MTKLSKEKRTQLVLVVLLTAGTAVGLWLGLIRTQYQSLRTLAADRAQGERKLREVRRTVENADAIESQLVEASNRVAKVEENMPSGDLYAWAITTIRQFKLPYKIDIPQFSQIDGPKDVSMLAGFPYKQATLTISGTALFYDFGKFVADFENQFPYVRILNLSLEPGSTQAGGEREKLSFRMDIALLVKPNPS